MRKNVKTAILSAMVMIGILVLSEALMGLLAYKIQLIFLEDHEMPRTFALPALMTLTTASFYIPWFRSNAARFTKGAAVVYNGYHSGLLVGLTTATQYTVAFVASIFIFEFYFLDTIFPMLIYTAFCQIIFLLGNLVCFYVLRPVHSDVR